MKKVLLLGILLGLGTAFVAAQSLSIYTEDSPPYNFKGTDGKPTGLGYDVVVEIQKRLKNTDPIKMEPWARGLDALDHEPNVILFSTNRTAERNPKYQWIGPIGENTFTFYAKSSNPVKIASLDDAKKVARIGVYLNDVREQVLKAKGFTNLDESNDVLTPVKKLMADRIDLLAGTPDEIGSLLDKAGFKMVDVKPLFVFQRTQVFIAASKATPAETVKAWNDAFASMQKDGTFETIYKKYLPKSPLPGPAITTF